MRLGFGRRSCGGVELAPELRERSAAGQLEEVYESLGDLFKWLKSHKRWNSTNIVVVGLTSHTVSENDHETHNDNISFCIRALKYIRFCAYS